MAWGIPAVLRWAAAAWANRDLQSRSLRLTAKKPNLRKINEVFSHTGSVGRSLRAAVVFCSAQGWNPVSTLVAPLHCLSSPLLPPAQPSCFSRTAPLAAVTSVEWGAGRGEVKGGRQRSGTAIVGIHKANLSKLRCGSDIVQNQWLAFIGDLRRNKTRKTIDRSGGSQTFPSAQNKFNSPSWCGKTLKYSSIVGLSFYPKLIVFFVKSKFNVFVIQCNT